MTQTNSQGQIVPVKPQANIYTVLLVISALALIATLAVMLYYLMGSYDMTLGQIFDASFRGPGSTPELK